MLFVSGMAPPKAKRSFCFLAAPKWYRLLPGLRRYLIVFAPPAFVLDQLAHPNRMLSPLVVTRGSWNFTSPPVVPTVSSGHRIYSAPPRDGIPCRCAGPLRASEHCTLCRRAIPSLIIQTYRHLTVNCAHLERFDLIPEAGPLHPCGWLTEGRAPP
jgi:hypothetical protein